VKASNKAILFFDANCGLCNRSVRCLIHQDTHKRLYFAPLQGLAAQAILSSEDRQSLQTVVYHRVVADGQVIRLVRSDAVLFALIDTGSNWRYLAKVIRCLPHSLRDWCYDRVAKNRHKIVRTKACQLPGKAEHARILP
jgi:predicted DCC family thiol-disulfide oxidoreductase YuxK